MVPATCSASTTTRRRCDPAAKQAKRRRDSAVSTPRISERRRETHDSASDEDALEKILRFPRKLLRCFGHRRHRSRPAPRPLLREVGSRCSKPWQHEQRSRAGITSRHIISHQMTSYVASASVTIESGRDDLEKGPHAGLRTSKCPNVSSMYNRWPQRQRTPYSTHAKS